MQASHESGGEPVEILPLVIVAGTFPARPSSLPDVRDFVRRQLTGTPVSDDDVRTLCERVAGVLLDAAGVSGSIQVSLRIFPASAEVDVLFSPEREQAADRAEGIGTGALRDAEPRFEDDQHRPAVDAVPRQRTAGERVVAPRPAADPAGRTGSGRDASAHTPAAGPPSFADWLAAGLRREGMTMETAARRLNVSTKTISRWVAGTTEPRLRDLYRIREVFGEPPFH